MIMPIWTSNITTITAPTDTIKALTEFAKVGRNPSIHPISTDFSFIPFVIRSALEDIGMAEKLLHDVQTNGIQMTKDILLDFNSSSSAIQSAILEAVDRAEIPKDVHAIHAVMTDAIENHIEQTQMFITMTNLEAQTDSQQVGTDLRFWRNAHLSYLGTNWFPEVDDIETNSLGNGISELHIRYDSANAPAINALKQISNYLQHFNEDFEIDSYYHNEASLKGIYEVNFKKDDLAPTITKLEAETYPLDIPGSDFNAFKSIVDENFHDRGLLSEHQLRSVFDNIQIGKWSSAVEYSAPEYFLQDNVVVLKPTTEHLTEDAMSGNLVAMKLLIEHYSQDASLFASKEAGEWRKNYEMSHLITSKINTCESCDCAISIINEIEGLRSDSYSSPEFNAVYDRLVDKAIEGGLGTISSNTAPTNNVREVLRMGAVLHRPKNDIASANTSDLLSASMHIIENDISKLKSNFNNPHH